MPSIDWYHAAVESLLAGSLPDLSTSTVRLALLTAAHTPNLATHAVFGDVSADELADAGYTAAGEIIANVAVTEAAGTATLDGDDVSWLGVTWPTGTRWAVAYLDATPASLLFLVDLDTTRTPAAEDFAVRWNAAGITTLAQV